MYRKVGPNTAMIRVSFESGDNAGRNGFFHHELYIAHYGDIPRILRSRRRGCRV